MVYRFNVSITIRETVTSPVMPMSSMLTCNTISISVAFGKLESIRYSPYIQQCLNELQESKEFEIDGVLVHMVQLQRLMEKIAQVNSKTELPESIGGIARAPDAAYMSTFQSELDKICGSLNKGQENNSMIALKSLQKLPVYANTRSRIPHGVRTFGQDASLRTSSYRSIIAGQVLQRPYCA